MSEQNKQAIIWWIVGGAVVIIAFALYIFLREPAEAPAEQAEPEITTEPEIRHPVPQVAPQPDEPPPEPLPPLGDSDAALKDSVAALVEDESTLGVLVAEGLVRKLVATIDNLPGNKMAAKLRPVAPTGGSFVTAGPPDKPTLSPENYARYEPYMRLIQAISTEQLAALYFRYYPLFQEAYQELGYPTGYFNDRLVQVIDHLLATPDVEGPVELTRPHVLYQYADPKLESLSAGQKILIRIGPQNAAVIKQKLRDFRQQIADRAPTVTDEAVPSTEETEEAEQ